MAGRRASREKEGKALDVDDSAGSRGFTLTQDEDPSYHASNVPPGERSLPSPLASIPSKLSLLTASTRGDGQDQASLVTKAPRPRTIVVWLLLLLSEYFKYFESSGVEAAVESWTRLLNSVN